MFAVIVFIIVLSILVFIHELGHYLAAKWAKVDVDEFGIGYPPKLLKLFRWKGTDFTLNLVPLGGFVRLAGENGPENLVENEPPEKPKKRSPESLSNQFYQATALRKLVIILAGVTFNLLFGVIIFAVVFTKMGIPTPISDARVGLVVPDSPAAQANIPVDVNIIAIRQDENTISTSNPQEVIEAVNSLRGQTVTIVTTGPCDGLTCAESAQEFELYLRTQEETPEGQGSMGVVFESYAMVFYPLVKMIPLSIWYGLQQTFFLSQQILSALGTMVQDLVQFGSVSSDLSGPVGIVSQASSTGIFEEGILTTLSFMAMLSINLAVINLLPISPLDGGRALFIALEEIFPKEISKKLEYYATYVGYLFLLVVIVLVTIRDVFRIFS